MTHALKIRKSAGVPVTVAVHRILAAANQARDQRAWEKAAEGYRMALDQDPELGHIWIQYGHALKETEALEAAEAAYEQAARLEPRSADAQLHIGHVRKRLGDGAGAGRAYLAAARLDPRHPDAVAEVQRLAALGTSVTPADLASILEPILQFAPELTPEDHAPSALAAAREVLDQMRSQLNGDVSMGAPELASKAATAAGLLDEIASAVGLRRDDAAPTGPALVFDVSDLISYFRNSRLPTGIQRVQIEIITQALTGPRAAKIQVCCFVPHRDAWLEVPASAFAVLARLSLSQGDRGAPEWLGALTRLQILLSTAEPMRLPTDACLINLGTSWWISNYFLAVRQARTVDGGPVRYIPFVHDLIPLLAPEVCAKGLTQDFINWVIGVFDHAETFLVNSQSTKRDLLITAQALGRDLPPDRVQVVTLDADARKPANAPAHKAGLAAWGLARTPFVLFVSTIEARKNHVLAFEAWLKLIQIHGAKAVPKLVCVGKRGWLDEAIHAKLALHEDLRDRVLMLSDLSDADLALLYRGCLFTLYPSTHEGWGLPVTESLCHGKIPVTSNGSSLPEAGGSFAVYFEAGSAAGLTQAVETLIYDANHRAALEARIAAEFKPRTWAQVAQQVTEAVDMLSAEPMRAGASPWAELGAYHPFGKNTHTRIWAGLRSPDIFRDAGWWGQDDFGCWTKPEGGRLSFRLDRPHGPLRLYARVIGLPGLAARATLEAHDVETSVTSAFAPGEARWMTIDLPARTEDAPLHEIRVQGDQAEDLSERTSGGDPRIISIGLAGFYVCEIGDALARSAFAEAVALGQLDDLAFNRAPQGPARSVQRPDGAQDAPKIDRSPPIDQVGAYLRTLEARVAQLEGGGPIAIQDEPPAPDEDEGTRRVADSDIRAAYRLLLNREPDAEGMAYYQARAALPDFTPRDLVQGLTDSDEHISLLTEQIQGVDVAGVQVSVDVNEPEFGRAIARDGVWEAHIIARIRALLNPGDVFVDIGANVGVMSFHAAQAVGPAGRVIAFEPNPDNVQRLLQGLVLNGFEQVCVHPVAVSTRAEVFTIRGSSNTHLAHKTPGGRLVQAFPADDLLNSEPRIDLIKLDIEGHEPKAIAGLARTLARHRPRMICEFNPRCLRDNLDMDPAAFAEQLFQISRDVQIIEHDMGLTRVATAAQLMTLWDARNAEHVDKGELADGLLHFDLLIQPEPDA